jgi:hypothetical protein
MTPIQVLKETERYTQEKVPHVEQLERLPGEAMSGIGIQCD